MQTFFINHDLFRNKSDYRIKKSKQIAENIKFDTGDYLIYQLNFNNYNTSFIIETKTENQIKSPLFDIYKQEVTTPKSKLGLFRLSEGNEWQIIYGVLSFINLN